jgi:hypothetical protein
MGTTTGGYTIRYLLENKYFADGKAMGEYVAVFMAASGGALGGYFLGSELGKGMSPGTGSSTVIHVLETKQGWKQIELLYCQNVITHVLCLSEKIENIQIRDSVATMAQKYYPSEVPAVSLWKVREAANLLKFVSEATLTAPQDALKEKTAWVSWLKFLLAAFSFLLCLWCMYRYLDYARRDRN